MIFSPLEQFESFNIIFIPDLFTSFVYNFGGFVSLLINYWVIFYLKNLFLITLIVSIFIFMLFCVFYSLLDIKVFKFSWLQYFETELDFFIWTLMTNNILFIYFDYFFFIFGIFCLILFSNVLGLWPYTYTVTSHVIFTFVLAFVAFMLINFIGIKKHGFNFFSFFLPSGAPLAIAPFLIVVELISYIARVFSLSIRLFANLMSGHSLLKILAGFIWLMIINGFAGLLFAVVPFIIVFVITGLELAIAILQAYVFSILVIIYFNDILNIH